MVHVFYFCVLVKNYSLLIMFSHMSQEVDDKSPKEINSFISFIIWVLQIIPPYKESRPRDLGRTRKEVGKVYA
jgi:hypothetical protein